MLRSSRNRPAQSRSSSRSSWRRRMLLRQRFLGRAYRPLPSVAPGSGGRILPERSRDVERRNLGIGSSRRSWGKFRRARRRLSLITRSGEARAESRVASVVLSHEPLCRGYLPVALNKIRTALGDLEIGPAPGRQPDGLANEKAAELKENSTVLPSYVQPKAVLQAPLQVT